MTVPAELLDEVCRYCDLRERLPLVPANARLRGVYFANVESVLQAAGKLDDYRALFPERHASMRWYPVSEFLLHLVIGASILTSPERVHEGMFEIGRHNVRGLSESLIGRMLVRLLARDPVKLLRQGAAVRRQTTDYGSWQISFPAPRSAVIQMRQEYVYIESYDLGAAQGTFDTISLPVQIQVALDDRFNGTHTLTW